MNFNRRKNRIIKDNLQLKKNTHTKNTKKHKKHKKTQKKIQKKTHKKYKKKQGSTLSHNITP